MPVKPEVQEILDLINAVGQPSLDTISPADMRQSFAALVTSTGAPVADVADHTIAGLHGEFNVRIYRPLEPAHEPPGVVVWFHGGGFVIGDLATTDATARALTNASGSVVVSVDYHLAPEFPFPAAVDDAMTATRWVVDNATTLGVDATRVAVGGDSAGGNLAAVTCQLAAAAHFPQISFQLLVYPVTELDGNFPSMTENGEGYFLTKDIMDWFARMYLGGRDRTNHRVSPLRATIDQALAPAMVITAEFDPLRDEGEAYAQALSDAGVETELVRFDGVIHGFFDMDHLADCTSARNLAGNAIRRAFTR